MGTVGPYSGHQNPSKVKSVQKAIKSEQKRGRLRESVGDCAGSVADYLGYKPVLITVVIGTLQIRHLGFKFLLWEPSGGRLGAGSYPQEHS